MRHLFKIVLAAMLVLTVLSCEMFDNSAGSFQIKFQWPEEGKPDFAEKEHYLWVVLEQWKDGDDDQASILMQTAPTKFSEDGKAKVDLSDVQYGEDLVLKVEIRGSTKTQDRVLYYGRSELFTFKSSDKDKEVKVSLQTQPTPGTGAQDDNGFSLKIVQNGNEVTKINDTVVSVRVRVINGTKIIIANSLSILEQYMNDNSSVTDGVIEKPVSEMTEAGEGLYDLEGWDLNTGLTFSNSDGGERVVYGKLLNDEGYVSDTVQATVVVDKTAPVVINPTVSPNPAKLDDVVTATFSFSEEIDPESLEFNWAGLPFEVDATVEGNLLRYVFVVSSEIVEKTYTLSGSAKDVIGNGPVEFQLGNLVIDRTKPSVVNEEVAVTDDKSAIKNGDSITVKFEVSEEIEGDPQVTVDGKKFSRVGEETKPYEFSYTISDSDIDGTKTILVSLTDKARNSDVAELAKKVVFDLSPPEIVNPTVTPSGDPGLASLDSLIKVRFNISEEVESLKFFINGTENTAEFTETVDGLTYTYEKTVSSDDSAVSAYIFSVTAEDNAGNTLAEQTLGTVNVDVVKPQISTHSISKTKVKLLESFSVELNLSEALSSLSLLVGSKDISSSCVASTTVDNQYVCTHVANEDDDEGDGVKQFSVMMTDLAGNSTTVQLKDSGGANKTIEYDVTPPDVVNPVVAPEKANLNSTIDVRFSFTENVESLTVDWGGMDGKFTRDNEDTNKKLFIYKHKVTEEDVEGIFPVTVTSAFDEAGNEISTAILIGNVEIDNSAPEVFNTEISVNDDSSRSYVVTNDSVKIVFEVHEEISDYSGRIGLLKIETCTEEVVAEGKKYTCTYATPSASDGEGTKDVTVEVKDLAGNAKSYPIGQLVFDMSDPEISSSIVIPEKVNLSSSDVQVKFSFSEDVSVLTEDISIVADPVSADALSLSCNTGIDYKKQFTCTATFDVSDVRVADYAVSVAVQDKAGNRVEGVSVGTVQIDREKPNITISDVSPVSVKSGESFVITFAVNEDLAADAIVKVGDKELPGAECSEVTPNNFSCTHIANNDGDETDGTKSVTVNLRDPAGNISTEILGDTISYDATRPSLINTIIIPEAIANRYDSNIQIRFSFSESINYPSSFDFKVDSKEGLTLPAFSCSVSGTKNQSFICQGTYPEINTDVDELTFSVKAADVAGNTLKEDDAYEILGTLEIDRKSPTIAFGDILPADINKSVNEVTVEFTVDETLVENPRVYLGSIMSTTPESSTPVGDLTKYTYKFADLSQLGDGYVSVTVEVSDLAGNNATNEYYNVLTVDRTSPKVMTSSLSPTNVNIQTETIQLSLTFSEPVDSFSGANITSSPSAFSGWTCQDPDAGGQNFVCSHDLNGLTLSDINYQFFVEADDLAGNPLEISPLLIGNVNVDKTNPTVSFTSVTPLAINKESTSITVSFTASEDLDRNPIVKIGSDLFSSTPKSNTDLDYTYEFTNLDDLSDGNKPVEVILTDVSGNEYPSTYGSEIQVDRTSPTVTPGGVAPAVANDNTKNITVFFSFSESVSGFDNGSLSVSPDGILTSYNCTNPAGDNQSFKCVFDLTAVTPADGAYEFFVEATDDAGNQMEAAPVKVGEVLLDTEGIEVTFNSVTPSKVNSTTGSVVVVLTTGEVPSETPVVKIGTELTQSTATSVTNGGKTFTYTFTSLNELADGLKNISANVEDSSGNVITALWSGTLTVDRTLPSIISSSVGPDYVNISTDQISMSISFSEAVSGFSGADISVIPSAVLETPSCSSPGGDNQTFICTINTSGLTETANGNYEFYATGSDVAGNSMSVPVLIGDVTVDRKIPAFTVGSFSPAEVNLAESQVSITFTVSEPLKMNPKVILGSNKVLTNYDNKTDLTYTYVFNDLSGITDGQKVFNISFEDVAGNFFDDDAAGPFFDRMAPYVISGGVAPGELNLYTQNLSVSFTFSEPVDAFTSSDISVYPSGIFPAPTTCLDNNGNRQSFTCEYDISSTPVANGVYSFRVAATDDFGNAMDPSPVLVGSLEADTVKPECTSVLATPLVVNAETMFLNIDFTVDSDLDGDPDVFIGSDKHLEVPTVVVGHDYTYNLNTFVGIPDGEKVIRIEFNDTFGNMGTAFNGDNVVFDRTRPSIVNSFASPNPVNENTVELTLEVDFSEPIDTYDLDVTPSLDTYLDSCSMDVDDMILTCVWTMPVPATDIDDDYTFTINAIDKNGNYLNAGHTPETLLGGGILTIDRTDPEVNVNIVLIETSGGVAKTPQIARAGDKVFAELAFSEALSKTPTVRLGAREMSVNGGGDCLGGTCQYILNVIVADGDGNKVIAVEMEDESGNVASAGFLDQAVIDVTAPTVTYKNVSPEYAKEGDEINAVFYFSEEIVSLNIASSLSFTESFQIDNSQFYYSYIVESSSPEGSFAFRVKASDPAGNISYGDTFHLVGTGNIDRTDPGLVTNYCDLVVSSGYALPSGVKAGAAGHIINADCNFVANESLAYEPVLKIGGNEFETTACGGGHSHCYHYEIQGDEGDGYKVLTVEIEDLAGNEYFVYPPANGMTATQLVAFDFTGPQLIYEFLSRSPNFGPARDEAGKTLHVNAKDPYNSSTVELKIVLYADEEIEEGSVTVLNFSYLDSYEVDENAVTLNRTMTGSESNGLYNSIMVEWDDKLGNSGVGTLSWGVNIDNSEPSADSIDIEKVTYKRNPWGSDSTNGVPIFAIEGSAGSVVDGNEIEKVLVYSESGLLIGDADVENDGSFSLPTLTGGNQPVIYVTPLEKSGNKLDSDDVPANLIKVLNVSFIATMKSKVPYSMTENQITLSETKQFNSQLYHSSTEPDQNNLNGSMSGGDGFKTTVSSGYSWYDLNEEGGSSIKMISALRGSSFAYRERIAELYVYGGTYATGATPPYGNPIGIDDNLYRFNLNLTKADKAKGYGVSPGDKIFHSMIYDSFVDKLVLFGGGANTSSVTDDLYFYDFTFGIWSKITPSGDTPSARESHAMVFDSWRNKYILFGGSESGPSANNSLRNDMWELDPQTETWEEIVQNGAVPSERRGHSLVFDPSRGKLLLFGGQTASVKTNDLYEFDVVTRTWILLTPTGTPPSERGWMKTVFDSRHNKIYFFSGMSNFGSDPWATLLYDVFTYDPLENKWTEVYTATGYSRMAYDKANDQLVFLGKSVGLAPNQIFYYLKYDPLTGSEEEIELSNEKIDTRIGAAGVYDPNSDLTYIYGGIQDSVYLHEMWSYEHKSNQWREVSLGGNPTMTGRAYHCGVYHEGLNSLVFFGGVSSISAHLDHVSEFRIDSSQWGKLYPSDAEDPNSPGSYINPDDKKHLTCAYDKSTDKVILYGGDDYNSYVWEWTASTANRNGYWTAFAAPGPGLQSSGGQSLVYDEDRERSILNTMLGTWSYDSSAHEWTELLPTGDTPEGRTYQGVAYDSAKKQLVMTGGRLGSYFLAYDLWGYRYNSTWLNETDYYNQPDGRIHHILSYSPQQKNLLMYGGSSSASGITPLNDVYILDTGYDKKPALMVTIPPLAVNMPENTAINRIRMTFISGGRGYSPTCSSIYGSMAYVWYNGRWMSVGTNYSSDTSPGEITVEIDDEDIISALTTTYANSFYIALSTVAPNRCGADFAKVSLDYMEVQFDYHIDGPKPLTFDEDDYYLSATSSASWQDAREECIAMGMDLVSIDSSQEKDFVDSYVTSEGNPGFYYWVGLHDNAQNLDWRSVAGKAVWKGTSTGFSPTGSYTNWRSGYPTSSTTYNCAFFRLLSYSGALWNYSCTYSSARYICEKPAKKFLISSDVTGDTWDGANQYCGNQGGQLIQLDNELDQIYMERSLVKSQDYWIGYSDSITEESWRWSSGSIGWKGGVDGDENSFNNWLDSEPAGDGDYAVIAAGTDFKWDDVDGGLSNLFVCEFSNIDCERTGGECQDDEGCCNSICEGGSCVACRSNDGYCVDGTNCCSGICNTGTHKCVDGLSTGQRTCGNADDCFNSIDYCVSGKCCRTHQQVCSTSSQCCYSSDYCYDSECCIPNGNSCIATSRCCRGTCEGLGRKYCVCVSYNSACTQDRDCCSGECGKTGTCSKGALGVFCNDNNDCANNNCYKGVCI